MVETWATLDAVERDPNKVGGVWLFRGIRVPVAALFENLRDGATIEQFLEWFPGVKREQVEAVLDGGNRRGRRFSQMEGKRPPGVETRGRWGRKHVVNVFFCQPAPGRREKL